ncbi:MAG: transcriptional repressor [Actinomycetota bacterium]|nr:transcriptional repressor [Actinomycetota bacterium]
MPVSHAGPRLEAPDLEDAIGALRARGLRVSAARRLVLEAIYTADGPISAEEVAGGLGGRLPRSDPASVYRNLETLEKVGLVRHFHLGHGPGRYVRAGDAREFLVCDSCGEVCVLERHTLEEIRAVLRRDLRYEAEFTHFPIVGLCSGCHEEE